jgi:hypothetical protein
VLKTGIYDIGGLGKRSLFGRPRQISLGLLRTTEAFEQTIVDLLLSNGTYRTTSRERFAEFNSRVDVLLGERFSALAPLLVHDWATSDASAALQWARGLRTRFPHLTFVASDKMLFLVEAFQRDGESYFLEQTGEPLQYARPPFVVSLHQPEYYPVNRWIAKRARRTAATLREPVAGLRWPSGWGETVLTDGQWRFRQVPLIHPEVRNFAQAQPWFRVQTHSVFEPLGEPAHVIRCMNIFNFSYFSREQLISGVRAVYASLGEGGVWIVGKSMDVQGRRTNATVFVKTEGGFNAQERIGAGSEIEDLALGDLRRRG